MCFSVESSLLAWVISLLLAYYLWQRNRKYDRWNASFLFTFTLIQLLEGGIWAGINNSMLTKLILVVLLLQPFVQTICAKKFIPTSTILTMMCIIYGIILIYTLIRTSNSAFSSSVGEEGHLVWTDSSYPNSFVGGKYGFITILYLLGLFIPLLYQGSCGIPLICIGILTALYSWYKTQGKEFSSLWCFTSVVYGLAALAM